MTDHPIEHLQEKVLAGSLLTASAGKAAAVVDTFVSWLVAAAGAALALLIGSLSDIAPYLPVKTVKCAAVLFLIAAGLTVVEKYLASIVVGAAEAAAHAAEIGRRMADEDVELDFSIVLKEFETATLPPMRWLVGRSFAKVQSGDFAASGRNFARCAQVQGMLALVIAIIVLSALGLIVFGLGG
jgi:hypothetical protein